MDPIAGLLPPAGATPAFLLRTQMRAPFGLELADGAPLSLVAAARGPLWIVHPDATVEVPERSVALVRGDRPWRLASAAGAAATAIVHPGQRCETVSGAPLADRWSLGIRTWGNAPDADATHVMLTGTYERLPATARWTLDALPGVVVAPADAIDRTLTDWFAAEIVRDELAQPVVLERMLDLLVVLVLRHWVAAAPDARSGLLRAVADATVGAAVRSVQTDPGRAWTVASLAREVGLSRAAFARRFTDLVGVPPITFLTQWRLAVAADRLGSSRDSIATIADAVGYANSFAFSTAFRRAYGISPQRYRTAEALG